MVCTIRSTEDLHHLDLPLWPSAKYLTHRVKYALDQLTGTLGPASGMKTVPFPKRGNAGKERTQKLRNDWSKREMTDFYRVISSYGIPFKRPSPTTGGKTKAEEPLEDEKDYVFIKEQAKLTQKTLDMIKQYTDWTLSSLTSTDTLKILSPNAKNYLVTQPQTKIPRTRHLVLPTFKQVSLSECI